MSSGEKGTVILCIGWLIFMALVLISEKVYDPVTEEVYIKQLDTFIVTESCGGGPGLGAGCGISLTGGGLSCTNSVKITYDEETYRKVLKEKYKFKRIYKSGDVSYWVTTRKIKNLTECK